MDNKKVRVKLPPFTKVYLYKHDIDSMKHYTRLVTLTTYDDTIQRFLSKFKFKLDTYLIFYRIDEDNPKLFSLLSKTRWDPYYYLYTRFDEVSMCKIFHFHVFYLPNILLPKEEVYVDILCDFLDSCVKEDVIQNYNQFLKKCVENGYLIKTPDDRYQFATPFITEFFKKDKVLGVLIKNYLEERSNNQLQNFLKRIMRMKF